MFNIRIFMLAVCAVICASQAEKLPVLKQLPSEVLFRVSDNSEFVLECVTVAKDEGVRYSWLKDGKPFTPIDAIQKENEGTLIFKKPNQSLEGQYRCLAQTSFGTASSRIVNVRQAYIDVPKVTLKRHKPIEGDIYKLDCHIPNSYPKPEITWLYQSLADPSVYRTIMNKRITLSPEGDLYFSNVTKEDTSSEHKYVCTAKSPAVDDYVVLAEHVLEDVVSGNPQNSELIKQYVSNDMTTKVGDVTMIYCIYGGTPLAHPDWYKDGKNVNNEPKDRITRYNRSAGKRLLIKETWLTDQGEYTCIVDNEVGKIQKHTIHLSVVSAPQFTSSNVATLVVKRGEHVKIPCEAAGVPTPQLKWTLNTHDVTEGERVTFERSSNGNTTTVTLSLRDARAEDTGYYGCHVSNEHGDLYAETMLNVQ